MKLAIAALCLFAAALTSAPAGPAPDPRPRARDGSRVPLADATWTNDSLPVPAPDVEGEADEAHVTLPVRARGERWATVFETDEPGTARLALDHLGGPDGLLYEVVLDGQRLSPARDAWRPTRRDLRTDLGPLWLGRGSHLLEFVAREEPMGAAALRPRALELAWR